MTFLYPLLLGGLALAGLPVLLHLIMRQKPKHVLFPAFRFLQQKARSNRRKVRLRHLLLLLLRAGLVALMCLALARPRVVTDKLHLGGDRAAAAVLVVDTSPSMGYAVGGKTRLDDAKERTRELLDQLGTDSRVAVLDTADARGEWAVSPGAARERLDGLALKPANRPVTDALAAAYRLFADAPAEPGADALPRVVFVFSDRTVNAWDGSRAADLAGQRDRLGPPAVAGFWVDVGVEQPADLAVTDVELPRTAVPANQPVVWRVTVAAAGQDADTEVVFSLKGDRQPPERKPVRLTAGVPQVVAFERRFAEPGWRQAEFSVATPDALPADNSRFATAEVRGARRILTLADEPADARIWKAAFDAKQQFACEVRPASDAALRELTPDELKKYELVCLFAVANPDRGGLWEMLTRFVTDGGRLLVVPGGEETNLSAYNRSEAQRLLPGQFVGVVAAEKPEGTTWGDLNYQHPLLSPFREWAQLGNVDFILTPRRARRYWEVRPQRPEAVVARYADAGRRPAVLESVFDRSKVRGRVMLFTTPLDDRRDDRQEPWNDYLGLGGSFYLVLTNNSAGYLAGDAEDVRANFTVGQTVTVPLPLSPRFPAYALRGPNVSGTDATLTPADGGGEVRVTATETPGNFEVAGGKDWVSAFSLNVPPAEAQLGRVPPEQVEAVLGKGSVVPVCQGVKLAEALSDRVATPVELLPALMMLVLVVLAVENWVANRFYRGEAAG